MTGFGKTESDKDGDDLTGFEDGNTTHNSSDGDVLNSNELGFQHRFAIFQKHCYDFAQVVVNLVQGFTLRMGAWKAWNKTNEKARLWAAFNYC